MDVQRNRRLKGQGFQMPESSSSHRMWRNLNQYIFCKEIQKEILSKSTNWTTKAGTFKTDRKVTCQFPLPDFHQGKDISLNMYADESDARLNSYDMIIGRDLLHELGIGLLFSLGVMKWNKATVPMRDPSQIRDTKVYAFEAESFSIHDPDTTDPAQIQDIMDVKYAPTDIDEMVSKCTHLEAVREAT
jgi:hypothetical protein